MDRKKILWLASWYPNRTDPFSGDFIQRHAQAVSLYHDVCVLFVVRDEKQAVTKTILEEQFNSGHLTERLTYYAVKKGPALLQKLASHRRYIQLFKKAIRQYMHQNGKPHLVHVHVTLKAGLPAAWIKKTYGIPYVLTEHASLFLPEAEESFRQLPFYFRSACCRIWNGSASISAVSQYLYGHLEKQVPHRNLRVIPNVVNTAIFQPKLFQTPMAHTRFLHVSGLGHPKNAEAILEACAYVKQKQVPFQLHIVGPPRPPMLKRVYDLQLDGVVFFHPEVPQPQLVKHMQQADALILYSRYETFGCVVVEANACGLPVIVSDIATMHELVEEGVNGVFAPGDNATALAERMLWFMDNRNRFDAALIARRAQERYDYKTVGLQFSDWYQSVLEKKT